LTKVTILTKSKRSFFKNGPSNAHGLVKSAILNDHLAKLIWSIT
jgi:hypothetical protein